MLSGGGGELRSVARYFQDLQGFGEKVLSCCPSAYLNPKVKLRIVGILFTTFLITLLAYIDRNNKRK